MLERDIALPICLVFLASICGGVSVKAHVPAKENRVALFVFFVTVYWTIISSLCCF